MKKNNVIKIVFVLLFCLFSFTPLSVNLQKQTYKTAVVLVLGIDQAPEGYEVSTQIVSPNLEAVFNKNLEVVSVVEDTLTNALDALSKNLGKDLGLAHLKTIVVGKVNTNIVELLNPLLQNNYQTNNAVIIYTKSSVKEFLKSSIMQESNDLSQIAEFNNKELNNQSTLINVFKNYKTPNSVNLLSCLELNAELEDAESENVIINNNEVCVLKNGNKISTLTQEEFENFNIINKNGKILIDINNFSDDVYENANFVIEIRNIGKKTKTIFKNGLPNAHFTLNLKANIKEVSGAEFKKEYELTNKLKNQIIVLVKQKIATSFNLLKTSGVDAYNFYDNFYKFNNKQFKNYLNSLNNKEEYFNNIQLFASVKISK